MQQMGVAGWWQKVAAAFGYRMCRLEVQKVCNLGLKKYRWIYSLEIPHPKVQMHYCLTFDLFSNKCVRKSIKIDIFTYIVE